LMDSLAPLAPDVPWQANASNTAANVSE